MHFPLNHKSVEDHLKNAGKHLENEEPEVYSLLLAHPQTIFIGKMIN